MRTVTSRRRSPLILIHEFRDDRSDRGFEIKQAALVKNHGHGGRGDDFGERSDDRRG